MDIEIDKIVSFYRKKSLWIIAGITLALLLMAQIMVKEILYKIIISNSIFALILSNTYIQIWKIIVERSPMQLNRFYLVASIIKMFLTLVAAIIGVILLAKERNELIGFLLIISIYYIFILVYDTIFFFIYEKDNRLNNK